MQGRTSTIGGRRFTNLKDDDATGRRREKKRPQSPQEEDATARKKKRPQPTDSVEVEEEAIGRRSSAEEEEEKALCSEEEEAIFQIMNNDSYGRVSVSLLYERMKYIFALSPTLLDVPTKMLSASTITLLSI